MQRQFHRVVNSRLAATSVVRPIEVMRPPDPEAPANVIVKPKEVKKCLPGVKLLKKLAKERKKGKKEKKDIPKIDYEAVEEAVNGILEDLER